MRRLFRHRSKVGPFLFYSKPFGLGMEEFPPPDGRYQVTWQEWRKKIKKLCPIQFWLRETFCDWLHGIRSYWRYKFYDIKCYFSPYNVLHLKTLPKTYSDPSSVIVHAMFASLERFFEKEPEKIVDWDSDDLHRNAWRELNKIYVWWSLRNEREKLMSKAYDLAKLYPRKASYNEKYAKVNELEKEFEEQETEMLTKLVKLRHFLWT